ncbi:6-hydroxymethylpterin diphosphokinase MptE-like protein [Treponema sp. C6A8]|uniref:6-hydroxymethylpterin diphosphokinase MptE-like protein n=1 Tax=Treponema sp. C6A8 TaxID=1410609 RepID=UPI0004859D02|nr:6-hydroxymethylpterin diphosphokinase MptE-like protein [Treponema sp. C6A8]
MPEQIQNEKPCLVNTPQGFSVSYKNKLLYSKYAPQKAILAAIEKLTVLPGTLFLCCSPVLPYGLKELCQKLDDKSFCVLCEFDRDLSQFSEDFFSSQNFKDEKTARLTLPQLQRLPILLNETSYAPMQGTRLLPSGTFKRVIRLDFSAGVQFHESLYSELTAACTRAIMTFWANRMTLVRFGRKYSQNFFKNLKLLPATIPIQNFFGSVSKPIIVFGAGQSLEEGIDLIKKNSSFFYILCADTALQPLLENGIEADGVFIEEAQSVIKKAFIGTQKSRTQIFAGLSAVPHLDKIKQPEKLSFFTTKYTGGKFLDNLSEKDILPPENEPFGSVGLTAVYYALKFRSSTEIPVYLYGLDFSYSESFTHARATMAHKERFLKNSRLFPLANFGASFGFSSEKVIGKNNSAVYTTRTLKNYAELFKGLFAGTPNLFDAASTGLELGLPHKSPEISTASENQNADAGKTFSQAQISAIKEYFASERAALEELRDLLTGKISLPESERTSRITELAAPREYLYLHFADGVRFSSDISFLKRIRTEIDFFLKFL